MKQIVINVDESTKNPELAMTAEGMVSPDYKERFKAEYIQVRNRYNGLKRMVSMWDGGELQFTPTCPREVFDLQLHAMKDYMDILVIRAKIEEVDL